MRKVLSWSATLCLTMAALLFISSAAPRAAKASDGQNTQAVLDAAAAVVNSPVIQSAVSPIPFAGLGLAIAAVVLNVFSNIFHTNHARNTNQQIQAVQSRVDALHTHLATAGNIGPSAS